MILTDARSRLRRAGRNINLDPAGYPDASIDQAIQDTAEDFALRTGGIRTTADLALSLGSAVVDLSSLTDFAPDRLLRAYLVNLPAPLPANQIGESVNLDVGDYWQILDAQARRTVVSTGLPRTVGFESGGGGALVDPPPNGSLTLRLLYVTPFTDWLLGAQGAWSATRQYYLDDVAFATGHGYRAILPSLNVATSTATSWTDLGVLTTVDPASLTLGLPDDIMKILLRWGGCTFLQATEPENAYAQLAQKAYLECVERYKSRGVGGTGKQVSYRSPVPGMGGGHKRRHITGWTSG